MDDREIALINALLDKYEQSRACKTGQASARRAQLCMNAGGKNDFSPYDLDDYDAREQYNAAVLRLQKEKLVELKWMRGHEDHMLEKVYLPYEQIARCYELIGRTPARDSMQSLLDQLDAFKAQVTTPWITACLARQRTFIDKNQRPPAVLGATDAQRNDYFQMLRVLNDQKEAECLERIFSMRCFGDSKRFEKEYRAKLLGELRRSFGDASEDMTDEELFQAVGLVKYPELLQCSGCFSLRFTSRQVDFTGMKAGACFSSVDLKEAEVCFTAGRILSIEKKANYYDDVLHCQRPDELVMYHGGVLSPARLQFYRKVWAAKSPDCVFDHWGDIDFGGFSMLLRLRRELGQAVHGFRMGLTDLQYYRESAVSFDEGYAERLAALAGDPLLADCADCMERMCVDRIRLEQEAMISER